MIEIGPNLANVLGGALVVAVVLPAVWWLFGRER